MTCQINDMFCFSYRSSGDDLLPCSFSAIYSHACADVLLIPKLHLQLAAYRSIWIVCLGLHYKGIVWGLYSPPPARALANSGSRCCSVLEGELHFCHTIHCRYPLLSWWTMLKTFFFRKRKLFPASARLRPHITESLHHSQLKNWSQKR